MMTTILASRHWCGEGKSAPLEVVVASTEYEPSDCLAGRVSGGPGPLEVVAVEPAGDIDHFTDEVEAVDLGKRGAE